MTAVIDEQTTVIEVTAFRVTKGAAKVDVRKISTTEDRWFVTAPCVLEKGEYDRTVNGQEDALDVAGKLVDRLAVMHVQRAALRDEEFDLLRSLREAEVSGRSRVVT